MLESLLTTLDRIYLKANRLSSIVEQQRIELNSVRDENQTLVRVNLELNQRLQDLEQKLHQGDLGDGIVSAMFVDFLHLIRHSLLNGIGNISPKS
jgi:hypothetical protein